MAWVGLVAAVAGSAMQKQGIEEQGRSAQAQADYQASEDDASASTVEEQAYTQANRIRKQGRINASAARAALGASGVAVDSGSGLEAQREIAANTETDALSAILSGTRQADTLRRTAQNTRIAGANANAAAQKQGRTALIQGVGQAFGGWQKAAGAR